MANQNPACDAYRLFMSGRLIALDKLPGVRPVGVGEMWCHIFTKCVLKVTGSEAPHVCRDGQICTGLELEIDGWVHGVQSTREANLTEEKWDFLLVDAKNAFNNINKIGILWMVRHLWLSGARFIFN